MALYKYVYDMIWCKVSRGVHCDTNYSPHWTSAQLIDVNNVQCLCWTVFARNKDTAVPAEKNGDLQTLICVLVARPRRCLTLSNPVPWQNWMAAYLGYTLQTKTLFRGWPVMVNDTHTRRRSVPAHASSPLDHDNWWQVSCLCQR